MANKHISHVKTTQTVTKAFGTQQYPSQSSVMGKRPQTTDLLEGEIAVSYSEGNETITISNKGVDGQGNETHNIVGFLNENVTYENEEIIAQGLGQINNEVVKLLSWGNHNEAGYLKGTASVVTVSEDLNNLQPAMISNMLDGAQMNVIYLNSGTTTDYSLSFVTLYKTPDGEQLNLTCPKNGYCEANFIRIGDYIYARGI